VTDFYLQIEYERKTSNKQHMLEKRSELRPQIEGKIGFEEAIPPQTH